MKAAIITIGDEILIGQIVDTNSAWLGEELSKLGVDLIESRSIKDDHKSIIAHLSEMTSRYDLILMTGGLGPTKDDITKKAIADFLGVEMYYDQDVHERIVALFKKFGREATEAHREQSFMPIGTTILENRLGTAPGMLLEANACQLISMPGVPYEMKSIFTNEVVPRLMESDKLSKIYHRTIRTIGMGETRIADRIDHISTELPSYIKLAFLPSKGTVRLRLSGMSNDALSLKKQVDRFADQIIDSLGDIVYGSDKDLVEEVVGKICLEKNLTISTAESCTGGAVAARIVSVPGSSSYYEGSVIAYSYELKNRVLGVEKSLLTKHGAVSEEVVESMVKGIIKNTGVDVGLAISGIAGPSGGTPDKPVGTIWMACGDSESIKTHKLQLGKNRAVNIDYTATASLNMLRKFLMLK